MRIAILIDNIAHLNGVSLFYIEFADWMKSHRINFELFGSVGERLQGLERELLAPELALYRSRTRLSVPFYKNLPIMLPYGKIAERLSSYAPDILHLPTPGPLGILGKQFGRKHSIPFTAFEHTDFASVLSTYCSLLRPHSGMWVAALAERYLAWFNRGAEVIFTYGMKDSELRCSERVVKVPFGIDLVTFCGSVPWPSSSYLADVKTRIVEHRRVGRKCVLYVGRFYEEKNVRLLLRLATLDKGIIALFVGEGPLEDTIRQTPNTVVLPFLRKHVLPEVYALADVFVLPSHSDTFGRTALEAMAMGVPTLISDRVGLASQCVHRKDSLIFKSDSITELRTCINELISSPELRANLSFNGKAFANRLSIVNQFQTICEEWFKLQEKAHGQEERVHVSRVYRGVQSTAIRNSGV